MKCKSVFSLCPVLYRILILGGVLIGLTAPAGAQGPAPEFVEFQSIPTSGARDWTFFTIGDSHYLAIANFYDDFTNNIDSELYRWDGTGFVQFQSIPTKGARDWEFFTIDSEHYLAVANGLSNGNCQIDSVIYHWDGGSFVKFQSISTLTANDWEFFTIGSDHYLAVANFAQTSYQFNINSNIYRWDGTRFAEFQSIPTSGARRWEFFTIDSEHYLAVANDYDGTTHNINSKIYWWDGTRFVEFQSVPTSGALDWESFTIGESHYLAVANASNGFTYNIDSKLYWWDGGSFVEFQSVATHDAVDWEFFTIGSDHYLAVANAFDGVTLNINSKLYWWDGGSFAEFQSIPTSDGCRWEFFAIDGGHYLAVANGYSETHNTDSIIYRLNLPPTADAGGSYSVGEGDLVVVTATGSDPEGRPLDFAWDLDNDGTFETPGQSVSFSTEGLDGPSSYAIAVQAVDSGSLSATDETTVAVLNVAPTIQVITAPLDPVDIDWQPINVEIAFNDPGVPDTHDVTWDWGDDSSDNEIDATSPATQDHTYAEAGVYPVTVTVIDDDGGTDIETYEFIVIYDPEGGFVTGGGWIWSEVGWCQLDDLCAGTEGKASFGFVSKYKKGATVPTGNTEFNFSAGDLNFHSSSYDWLVVTGSDYAKFKGAGTINGLQAPNDQDYKFMLWAGDGTGEDGADTFRIKIWWEEDDTEHVVYDNGMDQEIGGGNIVVHTK